MTIKEARSINSEISGVLDNIGSNRAGCAKVSNTKLTGVMVRIDNTDVISSSCFRAYAR